MKLYRCLVKPVLTVPNQQDYDAFRVPLERDWHPEEEADALLKKHKARAGSFERVILDAKYERIEKFDELLSKIFNGDTCRECIFNAGEYEPDYWEKRYCKFDGKSMKKAYYSKRRSDCPIMAILTNNKE